MNSLYTDKRNYFNVKLNLLHSHNKELRKQRIQEVENEIPKVTFDYTGFDDFLKKFKKQNKIYRKHQKNNWNNDGHLRTAFLQINSWTHHYTIDTTTTPITKTHGKKVVFIK